MGFVSAHSEISKSRMEQLMLNTGFLTKDLGTILVGSEAVNEGIINEVGRHERSHVKASLHDRTSVICCHVRKRHTAAKQFESTSDRKVDFAMTEFF